MIGLATSVALNLALIAKVVVFDPNTVLRPLCFEGSGPMSVSPWAIWTWDVFNWDTGIREIAGPPSKYFQGRIWTGRPPWEYRIANETVYIPLLDRYRYEELIWNWTTKAVERIIKEHERELDLPPFTEDEKRRGGRKIDCDLVRRIAIEKRDD